MPGNIFKASSKTFEIWTLPRFDHQPLAPEKKCSLNHETGHVCPPLFSLYFCFLSLLYRFFLFLLHSLRLLFKRCFFSFLCLHSPLLPFFLPSIYLNIFKLFSLFFISSFLPSYSSPPLFFLSFFSHLVLALLLSSSPPTHFSRYLRPSFSPFPSFLLPRNVFANLTIRHLFTLTFFVIL